MCGLVALLYKSKSALKITAPRLQKIFDQILSDSQSRGKDSSGIAALTSDNNIKILKDAVSAAQLIHSTPYRDLMNEATSISTSTASSIAIIAHTRMETHGSFGRPENNGPIIKEGVILVHNGIIVNYDDLWKDLPHFKRQYEVDSEILNVLIKDAFVQKRSIDKSLALIKGSYTLLSLFDFTDELLLATNTGSLYELSCKDSDGNSDLYLFASEYQFLQKIIPLLPAIQDHKYQINVIATNKAIFINTKTLERREDCCISVSVNTTQLLAPAPFKRRNQDLRLWNNGKSFQKLEKLLALEYEKNQTAISNLKRCTKCILPSSMPFITFDKDGVCNYCHNHQQRETRGTKALEQNLAPFLSHSKHHHHRPNCIVSFSGGRDSSYALHYVKKELGLRPIAYSYDWGMLTDLGRRNQARMTGKLNVEHVLISADIQKKRNFILQNWKAWMKHPCLGMVPLFMAGDKQYFYYLNKLKKDSGIDLVIYADNALEKTDFKYGFAGVALDSKVGKAYSIGIKSSLKLLSFYATQYLTNPKYLNSSLLDTFSAYISSYFIPKDYLYLFRYIFWDEHQVEDTLINNYEWELAPDTKSSWRIGDGTAAIYNYIYYTVAGFTEHDTFRSNQIRENSIERTYALKLANEGNRPRLESMLWYCDTIGLNAEEIVACIHGVKKLFPVVSKS
ncbi:MAG: hypothetical protein HQK52_07670 [Oligoflexia bacterium]|nr:hypothetical protein [Oligoflexia bacterium]